MGNGRAIKKRVNSDKLPNNPLEALASLLGDYYEFLSKEEKPTDEEVRAEFIASEDKWHNYCGRKHLTLSSRDLFKINVAKMWEHNREKK